MRIQYRCFIEFYSLLKLVYSRLLIFLKVVPDIFLVWGRWWSLLSFCLLVVFNFSLLNLCFYNMKVHLIRKMLFSILFGLLIFFFRGSYCCSWCFSVYPLLKDKRFIQAKYSPKPGWGQSPWIFLLTSWMIFREKKFLLDVKLEGFLLWIHIIIKNSRNFGAR